jgi:hypothetical protein
MSAARAKSLFGAPGAPAIASRFATLDPEDETRQMIAALDMGNGFIPFPYKHVLGEWELLVRGWCSGPDGAADAARIDLDIVHDADPLFGWTSTIDLKSALALTSALDSRATPRLTAASLTAAFATLTVGPWRGILARAPPERAIGAYNARTELTLIQKISSSTIPDIRADTTGDSERGGRLLSS